MTTVFSHDLDVLADNEAATVGTYQDQTLVFVKDSSPRGWERTHTMLASLGFTNPFLTQLAWWEDAELWRVEQV